METIFRRILTLVGAMLVLTSVFAQEIDEATAQQRALKFLQKSSSSKSKAQHGKAPAMNITLVHTSKGDVGSNYYVYNIGKDEGFILVSADEKAIEILGYADKGNFDYATVPANVKWWLSQYDSQITSLRKSMHADSVRITNPVKSRAASTTRVNRQDIGPLISTQWDQGYPYNSMIPTLGANYTGNNGLATGCAATAIAQILNYYKYPTAGKGKGSNTYTKTFPEVGNTTLTFTADFANATYDWDNMLNTYDGSESQASKDAVAKLMYHVGVANNMDYGLLATGGSGAIIQNIPHALIDYLGFDKSTTCEDRRAYTNSAWEELVYGELISNRPVLYSGIAQSGAGHTFVCDGYSSEDNHFHINWGWGGMCDGYYVLTATANEIPLQPSESGYGGAGNGASYSVLQFVEKKMMPDNNGDYECRISNFGGYYLDKISVSNGEIVKLYGGIYNTSVVEKTLTLGVRLRKTDTGENYYIPSVRNVQVPPNAGLASFSFQVSSLQEGKYEVYPVFYEASRPDDWQDVLSPVASIPVLYIGRSIPVCETDYSGPYLMCDPISILQPSELADVSLTSPKEYIINDGLVPEILIKGTVYSQNCSQEVLFENGFGIFKDGMLVSKAVAVCKYNSNTMYNFQFSHSYSELGTYEVRLIYRELNGDVYRYCRGSNVGYLEIENDGKKLTVSLKSDLGDANNSGEVNVADITAVVSHIYGQTPEKFNYAAADVNASGEINVADITGIVSIIYGGSASGAKGASKANAGSVTMSMPTVTANAGADVCVPIYIDNADAISAYQFDLALPENFQVKDVRSISDAHQCIGAYMEDGTYRVMSYSMTNERFVNSSAPVGYITLIVDGDAQEGTYEVNLSSAVTSANGKDCNTHVASGKLIVAGTTGISNVDNDAAGTREITTLGGAKMNSDAKLPKGVYIINGKKQVVR